MGTVSETADRGLVDDFADPGGVSRLGTRWRLVTDQVMGGVSRGRLALTRVDGHPALCLQGDVSLANGGGFVQVNLDLAGGGPRDASAFTGVRLRVRGNGESYGLHLKTAACVSPWQSYRCAFAAGPLWCEHQLPFEAFLPHRVEGPLDRTRLIRLGVVAIGRAMRAEVCLGQVAFY